MSEKQSDESGESELKQKLKHLQNRGIILCLFINTSDSPHSGVSGKWKRCNPELIKYPFYRHFK